MHARLHALAAAIAAARAARGRFVQRVELRSLAVAPQALRCETYFELDAPDDDSWDRAHMEYLQRAADVSSALDGLHDHVAGWLAAASARAAGPLMPPRSTALVGTVVVEELHAAEGGGGGAAAERPVAADAVFAPERLLGSTGPSAADGAAAGGHRVLLERGAVVEGGVFDVRHGAIAVGAGALIEPGAYVRGPAIIGRGAVVRHGAYLRGDVALCSRGVFGGELKHVLALPGCALPHASYAGDTLLGRRAHFGCGAVTANLPLFGGEVGVELAGTHPVPGPQPRAHYWRWPCIGGGGSGGGGGGRRVRYGLGRAKFGAVVGDGAQLGCGAVAEPGTLLGPGACAYPLSRLRGAYAARVLVKSAPPASCVPLWAAGHAS